MPELLLHAADRQSLVARTHEDAVDVQARRVAERFELRCCLFEVHGAKLSLGKRVGQLNFDESRIRMIDA